MATQQETLDVTIEAGSDLSSSQFLFMQVNASGQLALAGTNEKPIGVLMNKPAAQGRAGEVRVYGIAKVTAGGTISANDAVGANSAGQAVSISAYDSPTAGRALRSAVTGDRVDVLLTHEGVDRNSVRVYADWSSVGAAKGLAMMQSDGTAYDATADVLNLGYTQELTFGQVGIVGQTLPPVMDANGLNIGQDQTDNDGTEIFTGMLGASGRPFIIGDDPAFYAECRFQVADVSGSDDLHFGLRRVEAVNGTFDNYLDLVSLGWNYSANPAAIKIETILNNGATTSTDTTDTLADGTEVIFRVNVSAAGVVTYLIDGVAPTATAAFTFDDGDPVIPFFHLIQHGDLTEAVSIARWDVGFQ
jgi:hypothetical protein